MKGFYFYLFLSLSLSFSLSLSISLSLSLSLSLPPSLSPFFSYSIHLWFEWLPWLLPEILRDKTMNVELMYTPNDFIQNYLSYYWLKSLNSSILNELLRNLIKVPKVYFKTLGTSIIYIPMSPPSLAIALSQTHIITSYQIGPQSYINIKTITLHF